MQTRVSRLFPKADLGRITAAVQEAEHRTSAEIVPYVVDHSDQYEDAEWRCGVLLALVAFTVLGGEAQFSAGWTGLSLIGIGVATLAAGAVGMLLVKFVPAAKRFFAGPHTISRRVSQRAAEAFITEEVFLTHRRTGVLIFVSLLERRVLVVGDSGINARVKEADWHDIVHRVVRGIRAGKPADGLIEAIGQCGALLEKHGLHHRADDRDQLPDALRMKDS